MSLKELDLLLKTPVGQKIKKRKKKRKSTARAKSDLKMTEIESIQERIDNWRLSTEPTKTLIIVQRTSCIGCGSIQDATISPPMTGYTDRLHRTHYQPTLIPSRSLPIEIKRTELQVPICHLCYASAPCEARGCLVSSNGSAQMTERQLSLPFNKKKVEDNYKPLVPLSQTPQAILWLFGALNPIHLSYEE